MEEEDIETNSTFPNYICAALGELIYASTILTDASLFGVSANKLNQELVLVLRKEERYIEGITSIPYSEFSRPEICPAIVKICAYINGNESMHYIDIGFMTSSDGTTTTVVGRAYMFYDKEIINATDAKVLIAQNAKVTVSLQTNINSLYTQPHQVDLVYVDFFHDIAVMKFKSSEILPTVKLGSSSNLHHGKPVWTRFFTLSGSLLAKAGTVRDVPV